MKLQPYQHPGPFRDILGILLEQFSVGGSVQQSRQLVVYGVVVDICTVDKRDGFEAFTSDL